MPRNTSPAAGRNAAAGSPPSRRPPVTAAPPPFQSPGGGWPQSTTPVRPGRRSGPELQTAEQPGVVADDAHVARQLGGAQELAVAAAQVEQAVVEDRLQCLAGAPHALAPL